MKLVKKLGNPTWNCRGTDLGFVGNEFLVSTGSDRFSVVSISTGEVVSTWRKYNEDLNCLCRGADGLFLVGGSFGSVYTLSWRFGKTVELIEEREVLLYLDAVEYCGRHNVVAVVCDTDLRLLPNVGLTGIKDLTFSDKIRSVQWSDRLDAFLVVSGRSVFAVSVTGERFVILERESRVLTAKYHDKSDSLTLLFGISDNDAMLTRVDRRTLAPKWTVPCKLDHQQFRTTSPRQVEYGSLHVTQSGESIVAGVNWLARYSPDGEVLGQKLVLSELIQAVCASPDGDVVASAGQSSPLRVWNRDFHSVLPRDCHYSSIRHLTFAASDSLVVSGDQFSPDVLCWNIESAQRQWRRSDDGIWCDGLIPNGTADDELLIASSEPEVTTMVRVACNSGELLERVPLKIGYRACVRAVASSELILAPSWAYGPRGTASVVGFPSLETQLSVTAGNYELGAFATSRSCIAAADRYHIWLWQRNDPARPRDFAIPQEQTSPHGSVVAITFTDDRSFIVVTTIGAFLFSTPEYKARLLCKFSSPATCASEPNRRLVVVGFEDGRAERRAIPDFVLHDSCVAHEGHSVSAIANARHKALIATGATDGTLAVWDCS